MARHQFLLPGHQWGNCNQILKLASARRAIPVDWPRTSHYELRRFFMPPWQERAFQIRCNIFLP